MTNSELRAASISEWLCPLAIALLSCLAGAAFDYFARGALNYAKTGVFEIYMSGAFHKVFIGLALLSGTAAYWMAARSRYAMVYRRIAIILSFWCVLAFGTLLLVTG